MLLNFLLAAAMAKADVSPPLAVDQLAPARWVASEGRSLTAFELVVRNEGAVPVRLEALELSDRGRVRTRVSGAALADRMLPPGGTRRQPTTAVEPGETVIVYVETGAEPGQSPRLMTRLSYAAGSARTELARPVTIVDRPPVVLAPPLRTGAWVAVHWPDWDRGHRRVTFPHRDSIYLPGRYAIDFVGVADDGRVSQGQPDRARDAVGYGAPVYAGADGVVVAAVGDQAEAELISKNPKHGPGREAGNHVALRLPGGEHVFYEHLRPGSITVRKGQRVRRGERIGELGFSGDSTGPHLHMHVATGSDPIRSQGVPFTISRFEVVGRYADLATLGTRRWQDDRRGETRAEWPGYNVVVRFAPRD